MTPGTDERVARLYGLPLEEFTAERNALAAELRPVGLGPIPEALAGRKPAREDAAAKRRAAELAAMLKAARDAEAALRREADAADRALARAELENDP